MQMFLYLSSGLFLGWSLGANHASHVFGTAVGTKMLKFRTAAILCSIFVILGAFYSGAGATHTLGQLGSVNAIAGSFMVALSTACSITWMTKLGLPVSSSQVIIGAIIGWNFFSDSLTDYSTLGRIVGTWLLCPILAATFALFLYLVLKLLLRFVKIHLFRMDAYNRLALILVGAFGSYSLGANNISNVMGVFVPVFPFKSLDIFGYYLTGTQQLFLLGGIAIAVGVFTYSYNVIKTVGTSLLSLTPQTAFIVVLAESLVLFLFASEGLENFLIQWNLPTFPLVPVSSSQAVIGAVLGIGLAQGGKNIRWRMMSNIVIGWVVTPLIAFLLSYVSLFFLQNVFSQTVYRPIPYMLTKSAITQAEKLGIPTAALAPLVEKKMPSASAFTKALQGIPELTSEQKDHLVALAEMDFFEVTEISKLPSMDQDFLSQSQWKALKNLEGRQFLHKWQFHLALQEQSKVWCYFPAQKENRLLNKAIQAKLEFVYNTFRKELNN